MRAIPLDIMQSLSLVNTPALSDIPIAAADLSNSQPQPIPYLQTQPEVIDISKGRQLFVDDYLLLGSDDSMARVYHKPQKYACNPVFFPQSKDECHADFPACTVAKSGGVWFDDKDQLFKMWYMAGYLGVAALATSKDGIHWERPSLDIVPGTNLILPPSIHPDSGSVIIDHNADDASERYKMLVRVPNPEGVQMLPAELYASADGIHWKHVGTTGLMDDRSTFYYNPFRQCWVQSIRRWDKVAMRCRHYHEGKTFVASGQWTDESAQPWLRADNLDIGKCGIAQLYNLDAIAYESIMIGFHQILHGPANYIGERSAQPKFTELQLGFSRNGYHWYRPDRTPFIAPRREYGAWDYGYVESSAGMCLIVGDELWFYYSAYAGEPERITKDWRINGMYGNGAVGLAKMRRDGFASLRPTFPGAMATTRKLFFPDCANKLFINAITAGSKLTVAVLDETGAPIPGLGHSDCLGFSGNSTCAIVRWKERDLHNLGSQQIRFNFRMDKGDLYAFWVTDRADGKSGGYTAAGGPGLTGLHDN